MRREVLNQPFLTHSKSGANFKMKNKFFRKATHQNFILFHFLFPIFTLLAIFNIFSPGIALAVDVKLQWDSTDQAAGYKLYYGIESRAYDFMIDVGSSLQYTVPDLNDNQLYYFAITAYNEFDESDFSEEISYKPVINQPPIADAGPDQTVNELTTVTLSGSNSIDLDNGIAEFLWEQLEGTSVNLVNPAEEVITFTAPDTGPTGEALVFSLTVKDYGDLLASDTCIVNVSAENSPPKADAGPDQIVSEGELVTLDASNSSDQDDGIYSYQWLQISGTPVELSISDTVKPTFISPDVDPEGESLRFQLTVSDHGDLQSHDECIVNVTWINEPPIADAGPDQIVQDGEIVALDGSGSKDVDDGISSYMWSQTSGPPVNLSNPAVYQPSFRALEVNPEDNPLTFTLTISDNGGLQSQDSSTVTVNSISKSDTVGIIETLYNESKKTLYVTAESDAPVKSVVLSAWTKFEFDSKEVELGQLRYDKKMELYKNTFRKINSNPTNITVKSSGGGFDTQP